MNDRPTMLCEAFQLTAAIKPDAVAVRSPGGAPSLTWQQYADQVRQVAAGLAALGIGRGDTVALLMANRVEFYPLEVGAQHVGATSFSVYNTLSAEQLNHVFGRPRGPRPTRPGPRRLTAAPGARRRTPRFRAGPDARSSGQRDRTNHVKP